MTPLGGARCWWWSWKEAVSVSTETLIRDEARAQIGVPHAGAVFALRVYVTRTATTKSVERQLSE
jgi:hypothetical protein